jgi:hypothetical protein
MLLNLVATQRSLTQGSLGERTDGWVATQRLIQDGSGWYKANGLKLVSKPETPCKQ